MRVVGCPSCEQNIAVEDFVPAAATIQCPFCQADRAVANMAASRLPVAVVLEMPAVEVPDDPVPSHPLPVGQLSDEQVSNEEASDDALDDQPLGEDGELRGPLDFDRKEPDSAAIRAGANEDSGELAFATDERTESKSEADEFGLQIAVDRDVAPDDGVAPAKPEVAPTPRRRRKKEPNALFFLVQVVAGGLVGIGGTVLGLLWLPGSLRRDPFDVGYSIGKVAPWIVPAHFRPTPIASDSGGEASTKQANQGKPSSKNKTATGDSSENDGVADLPSGELDRRLDKRLNQKASDNEKTSGESEELILAPDNSGDDSEMDEGPLAELPDTDASDADAKEADTADEESAAKASDNDADAEEEAVSETTPADNDELTAATEDVTVDVAADEAEDEARTDEAKADETKANETTSEPSEVVPAVADEPVESTEPSADAADSDESSTLTKVVAASEALARVLGDKELPVAQQREAAQSFYSAICDLSEVRGPAAIETLVKTASDPLHAQTIARGAASFLDKAETIGKPLVVAGKVMSTKKLEQVTEIKIHLATKDAREVVLVVARDDDSTAQADDAIVAIGFLIDCEKTPLEGYEGTGKVLSQARVGRIAGL